MSQERSEAIVLRSIDFSETSRIVTFLTPGRGKLACLALGARRAKSNLAGCLDTLNRLELVYYWRDSRTVQKLGEAALLDSYAGIRSSLDKSLHAAFPLELVYKVAHENEPSQDLYAELVHGLAGLANWNGDTRTHVCWQVLRLLYVAGFGLSVGTCVECAQPIGDAGGFSLAGGLTCPGCRTDVRLSADDVRAFKALGVDVDICPAAQASTRVLDLLRRYASRQLDTDFRSGRVIDQALK